jgi:hypothetical protein
MSLTALNACRAIYTKLAPIAPAIQLRELLQAVVGLKASRFHVRRKGLADVTCLHQSYSFGLKVGVEAVRIVPSSLANEWSDKMVPCEPDDPEARYTLYVGQNQHVAEMALLADVNSNHEVLGEILGIPKCCRQLYRQSAAEALANDGDIGRVSLYSAPTQTFVSGYCNYLAQYFGWCLISHYPCKMNCEATSVRARESFKFLSMVDPCFASMHLYTQMQPHLHLGSDGIIMLRGGHVVGSALAYFGAVAEFTKKGTEVFELVMHGDAMRVRGQCLEILNGGRIVGTYSDEFRLVIPRTHG